MTSPHANGRYGVAPAVDQPLAAQHRRLLLEVVSWALESQAKRDRHGTNLALSAIDEMLRGKTKSSAGIIRQLAHHREQRRQTTSEGVGSRQDGNAPKENRRYGSPREKHGDPFPRSGGVDA